MTVGGNFNFAGPDGGELREKSLAVKGKIGQFEVDGLRDRFDRRHGVSGDCRKISDFFRCGIKRANESGFQVSGKGIPIKSEAKNGDETNTLHGIGYWIGL